MGIRPGHQTSDTARIEWPDVMSYPANNHLEVKVEEISGGSKVTLRHRAIGMIDPEHRKGIGEGWNICLPS